MSKRIFLALPIEKSTVLTAFSRALSYLDWEYQIFDYRVLTYPEKALRLAGQNQLAYRLANKRLVEALKDFRPNIFFTIKGEKISPETYAMIKKMGILIVNWFPDDVQAFVLAKRLLPSCDVFCHFDSWAITQLKREYRRASLYHFSFAADILSSDRSPDFDLQRKYDLSLVGNYYPVRAKILPAVQDLGLNVWGGKPWLESNLKRNYHGWLPFESLFKILSNTKIGLNIQYPSPSWSLVNRAYDTMTCGAMLLTEDKKEAQTKFEPGKDLVIFNNSNILRQQAQFYLNNPAERVKIARNGYRLLRDKYTYVREFRALFKHLALWR